ncbi:MAG: ATPase, T2SS/T4P/T4SS family, partial [Candidatus Korobacteraceae bacterium]
MANTKTFGPDMRVGSGTWTAPRSIGVSAKAYQELKTTIHRELLSQVDLEKLTSLEDVRARAQVQEVIQALIVKQETPLSTSERDRLSREVLHEVFGLGPLEPLLQDATINDILVNTYRQVYVERAGVLEKTSVSFKDDAHLNHIIDKIVSQVGRRVDESSPMCDARLADGSRVNVIIPPLAVDGAILSIRRFGKIPIASEQLLANRTITAPIFEALKAAVRAKLNIVISGGTGAGKTTLLNVLSGYISDAERI